MSITTSPKLQMAIPGATTVDTRLADIQAVKSALLQLDSSVATLDANGKLDQAQVPVTKNVLVNAISAAYSTVADDAGKVILHPTADTTARTFTIPANAALAYEIGTVLTFINQHGAGAVTIACGDSMYLAGAGTTGNRLLAANGAATAVKITATEWFISGTGLS